MSNENHFGAGVAETYDRNHSGTDPVLIARTVDVLENLAAGGRALEFAIGTGRIALPLAARGVAVSGNELSPEMVDELRKKPGGDGIEVTLGDMTAVRVDGAYSLVFLVFNTLDNLRTQAAQVACFANAAQHLAPGGRFLVETLLPPLQHLPFGETKRAFACDDTHWGMDDFDITTQTYASHHIWMKDGETQRVSVPFRYAWPAEMDLMAKMAGMELEHRWGDWDRSAFTNRNTKHISVWRKPD